MSTPSLYLYLTRRVHICVDAALIQQDGVPPEVGPHDTQREALIDRMHLYERTGGDEGGINSNETRMSPGGDLGVARTGRNQVGNRPPSASTWITCSISGHVRPV